MTKVESNPQPDMVNEPPHYQGHWLLPKECIEYSRLLPFDEGNAFKYLYRFEDKASPHQDIEKAVFYIEDCINMHPGRTLLVRNNAVKPLLEEAQELFEQYLFEAYICRTREPESPIREDAVRIMLALLSGTIRDIRGLYPVILRSAEKEYGNS